MDELTEVYMCGEVFHCNLDRNNILVSVQSGDILGLKSPERSANDIMLGFAKVSGGPTNYMVGDDERFFSPAATSSNDSVINYLRLL